MFLQPLIGQHGFLIIVGILAVLRMAKMITADDGPFMIFFKIRALAGTYDRNQSGLPRTNLGRFFGCPHCIGVWVALVYTLLVFPPSWLSIIYWLAIAGGQSWMESMRG